MKAKQSMRNETEIARWLDQVKFKKQLIGGVNESDVWKKIRELHAAYQTALRAERMRYDALLSAKLVASEDEDDGIGAD